MNNDLTDPVVISATAAQERQSAKAQADPATDENAKNTAIHEARAKAEEARLAAEHDARRIAKRKLNEANQREKE